jgi:hypothetical protein
MRDIRLRITATLLGLYCATVAYAQQPQPTAAVPKLVRFSGSFRPANGLPPQSVESVTLAVYRDQTGGNALWQEIQNVAVDADGHYSLLMGATQNEGMPLDLFASGEPRWLGAQFNRPGEVEEPRVLLVSVPYALKASDAETLGGRPASAYLLAGAPVGPATALDHGAVASTTATTAPVKPNPTPANAGIPNYIGKFANTTDLVDSAIYEVNGNVGISTTTPKISLDVRTGSLPQMGIAGNTDYLTFFASDQFGPAIYWDPALDMRFGKGGTGLYNPYGFVEYMRIKSSNGNVGLGTPVPGSKLDVNGDINFTGSLRYFGTPVMQLFESTTAFGLGADPGAVGESNTAFGYSALHSVTDGYSNTAIGTSPLYYNTLGSGNTALGYQALVNNTTGSSNIGIGYYAGASAASNASNNIYIGNNEGFGTDNGTIRIGAAQQTSFFVAGVRGVTTAVNNAVPVMIDSNGQLGTTSSSRRFKEDIEDMGATSHDLMRLRPVTYRYKQPFTDGTKPIQYGLIAEEVAEVYPDLVAHSADGQIETVKYQVLDSMLLNEMQRQQAQIGDQKDQIRRLEQRNQSLEERLAKVEATLASTSGVARGSGIQ